MAGDSGGQAVTYELPTESERNATREMAVVHVTWDALPVGYNSTWTRTITQELIDLYCDGVEDRHPWYGPFRSPLGPPIAPPLLPSRLSASTLAPLGGGVGHVHVRHRDEIKHPVTVGTELTFTGTVVDKFERPSGKYTREVIEARRTSDGELVNRDIREYLLEKADPGAPRPGSGTSAAKPAGPTDPPPGKRVQTAGNLELGGPLPAVLHKDMIIQLMRSRFWGSTNPLHWDAEFARERGWRAPLATGTMTSAYLAQLCVECFGLNFFTDSVIAVKFVQPVFAGDHLDIGGTVADLREIDGRIRATVQLACKRSDGATVTAATTETWVGE